MALCHYNYINNRAYDISNDPLKKFFYSISFLHFIPFLYNLIFRIYLPLNFVLAIEKKSIFLYETNFYI
jgi:hypothetical protein